MPNVLLRLMVERIAAGMSTLSEAHVAPTPSEIAASFSNILVRD